MDHGMQGQDAAVGQGEDGLVMAFTLVAFALVLGLADGIGWRETKADRNMACLSLLLPPWEICSPLVEEPDLLVAGAGPAWEASWVPVPGVPCSGVWPGRRRPGP